MPRLSTGKAACMRCSTPCCIGPWKARLSILQGTAVLLSKTPTALLHAVLFPSMCVTLPLTSMCPGPCKSSTGPLPCCCALRMLLWKLI